MQQRFKPSKKQAEVSNCNKSIDKKKYTVDFANFNESDLNVIIAGKRERQHDRISSGGQAAHVHAHDSVLSRSESAAIGRDVHRHAVKSNFKETVGELVANRGRKKEWLASDIRLDGGVRANNRRRKRLL
jgi:hypothetical protein